MVLDQSSFNKLIEKFEDVGIHNSSFDFCDAFVCTIDNITYIIIDENRFSKLNSDMKRILIVHECAHAIDNIVNEELADYWTFDYLNKKQINILKSMWKDRHGRTFSQFIKEN